MRNCFRRGRHESIPNPFWDDIFLGWEASPCVSEIHERELLQCREGIEGWLSRGSEAGRGEIATLVSPRAGYGKSHLIARIREEFSGRVLAVRLPLKAGETDCRGLLLSILEDLEGDRLETVGGDFLSGLIDAAIRQGVVDSGRTPEAPANKGGVDSTSFDRDWMRESGREIIRDLDLADLPQGVFSRAALMRWTNFFLGYLSGDFDLSDCLVRSRLAPNRDSFLQFLNILSDRKPLLVVADDLDGCRGLPLRGQAVGEILSSISDRVPRSFSILSLNEEVWNTAFGNHLASGLHDRLSSFRVNLSACNLDDARKLLLHRLTLAGVSADGSCDFVEGVLHEKPWESEGALFPRRILREACRFWSDSERQGAVGKTDGEPVEQGVKAWLNFPSFCSTRKGEFFDASRLRYPDRSQSGQSFQLWEPKNTDAPRESRSDMRLPLLGDLHSDGTDNSSTEDGPVLPAVPAPLEFPGRNVRPGAGKEAAEWSGVLSLRERYLEIEKTVQAEAVGLEEMDFALLERLFKKIGDQPGSSVSQKEVTLMGSQTACLRWDVEKKAVWLGFEPTRNIFYYSHLLQKVLTSEKEGKIVCFSSESHPFRKELLTTLGLGEEMTRSVFDVIELGRVEWGLIKGAMRFLDEAEILGRGDEALPLIKNRLNPLWRRVFRPRKGP